MIKWKKGPRYQGAKKTFRARSLRRQMTDAEIKLWQFLKNRNFMGLKFRRQVPFGPFYLDFYCPEKKTAIELDGGQHYIEEGRIKDDSRDKYLHSIGIKVIRYSDSDVLVKTDAILEDLKNLLTPPSPLRGEEKNDPNKLLTLPSPLQGEEKRGK